MTHPVAAHCRLLYVDDDPTQRVLFKRLFARSGLTVTVAATPAEAKAAAKETRFDVVVLDLDLGAELGTSLACRLHESLPDALFFLVTGTDLASIQTGPADQILRGVFPKPLVFQELLARIDHELAERGGHSLAVLRRVLMIGRTDKVNPRGENAQVSIQCVDTLTEAMPLLHSTRFDAVSIRLGRAQAECVEPLEKLRTAAPETALVALIDAPDDQRTAWLLRHGAEEVIDSAVEFPEFVRAASLACDRKSAQRHWLHLARRDAMTGLCNRQGFAERFQHAQLSGVRGDTRLAIAFIDLDGFKAVNDHHGHEVGDAVLIEVARRFRAVIRKCDTLARTGGDEFLLLIEGVQSEADLELVVSRLEGAVAEPFFIGERALCVGASVGFVIANAKEARFEDLVRRADAAMYAVKGARKQALYAQSSRRTANAFGQQASAVR